MSSASPRIAFVGAGAIGGYVGSHIFRAGYDVRLIDQWPANVDAINRDGMHFSGTLGEYSIKVPALHICDVQSLAHKPVDIAFICTKLYDTAWATSLISQYLAPDGFVVTLQNSVVEEIVARIVGWGRTIGCIASTLSAEAYGPGKIIRTRQAGGSTYTIFRAGELHGRITQRLENVVRILSSVDSAKATTNLWGERWSKLVANTMTTGVCGVSGLNLMEVLGRPDTQKVLIRLADEAIRIGHAHGFTLEKIRGLEGDVWIKAATGDGDALSSVDTAIRSELGRMTADGFSGTAQDLKKGRRTEIDYMNGYVAEKGTECRIAAPTHVAVTHLVKQVERGEITPSPEHILTLLK
jgi:2-dehydropantoate 2-reductase